MEKVKEMNEVACNNISLYIYIYTQYKLVLALRGSYVKV